MLQNSFVVNRRGERDKSNVKRYYWRGKDLWE